MLAAKSVSGQVKAVSLPNRNCYPHKCKCILKALKNKNSSNAGDCVRPVVLSTKAVMIMMLSGATVGDVALRAYNKL
jgi:hypothetical protein